MRTFLGHIATTLFHLGGVGLFSLGVLDSSFLMMPLGNDLLIVALTASHHQRLPYYVLMATAGSVLGCLIVDWVSRKGGEAGLERRIPRRRLDYIKDKIEKRAGWAIMFASLMPPPFPFTPFVAATAAFQFPRGKLLGIIALSRLLRFSVEGVLAIYFGRRILAMAKSPEVEYAVLGLIVIAIAGSAFSVYRWVRGSGHPKVHSAGGQ
ncbi:MAG TPA: VTT domain-containing protein [Bryobacteraceae bacterium]|nr:VTT domain-containing protein [Bryobacteraceae bacterium]